MLVCIQMPAVANVRVSDLTVLGKHPYMINSEKQNLIG